MVEHSVVVMTAVLNQDDPMDLFLFWLNPIGSQFSTQNLCSESVGSIKFWDPVGGFDTGDPSWITLRMEYLFAFQFWCCELRVKNQWGGDRKNWFLNSFSAVTSGYFYVLFLWAIAVSNFRPLEIDKNLGLPLSTITFTVNSHADNHFYKYISLFQVSYSMK